MRTQPRDQHLQGLRRSGRAVVAPDLLDEPCVAEPRRVQRERREEVGRSGAGDRGPRRTTPRAGAGAGSSPRQHRNPRSGQVRGSPRRARWWPTGPPSPASSESLPRGAHREEHHAGRPAAHLGRLLTHGTTVHPDSEVVTCDRATAPAPTSYARGRRQRAAQLAHALRGLGVDGDQRVATFMWNNAEHLEAYLAIPSMGAVLHTLNIRLFPEQLTYIANHAEDQVVIVDASLVAPFATLLPHLRTVQHVIVAGPDAATPTCRARGARACQVGRLRGLHRPGSRHAFDWPDLDERSTPRRCATPPAPPATPRASSTATARPTCTRWRSRMGDAMGLTPDRRWPSSRCSTPTPGACPTPPAWPGVDWSCPTAACSPSRWRG